MDIDVAVSATDSAVSFALWRTAGSATVRVAQLALLGAPT
jgi:hypothetical protein